MSKPGLVDVELADGQRRELHVLHDPTDGWVMLGVDVRTAQARLRHSDPRLTPTVQAAE